MSSYFVVGVLVAIWGILRITTRLDRIASLTEKAHRGAIERAEAEDREEAEATRAA